MNRFTEELLSLETVGFWAVDTVLKSRKGVILNYALPVLNKLDDEVEGGIDRRGARQTFICLLAAMSDEDLFECFGV